MPIYQELHALNVNPSIAIQLGKLIAGKGMIYDEHQRLDNGLAVKTIARVAVFEREGEQFLIPIYDGRSSVNPLLDRGEDLLTLSKRTIGSVVNGSFADCVQRYNADENNLGRFITEVMTLVTPVSSGQDQLLTEKVNAYLREKLGAVNEALGAGRLLEIDSYAKDVERLEQSLKQIYGAKVYDEFVAFRKTLI